VQSLLKLEFQQVLKWLKDTKNIRWSYINEKNQDVLFELILKFAIDDVEALRYLLIDDPGSYRLGISWNEYTKFAKTFYLKNKQISRDLYIEDYLNLAIHLSDSQNLGE